MRYCKCCHLTYKAPLEHCPFCSNALTQTDGSVDTYHYPEFVKKKHTRLTMQKLMSFLSLIGIAVCLLIDLLTGTKGSLSWSCYPITSLVYFILLVFLFTSYKPGIQKVTGFFYLTILYVVLLGSFMPNHAWVYEFIYPLGILGVSICLCFNYVVFHRKELYDVAIYLLIASLLGLIPAIVLLCKTMTYTWPSIACVAVSLLIIAGLFFFSTKQTKEELKRRFHL